MEVIGFLLPICILLGSGFLILFLWATKRGQYDDLDTPASRILFDDENIVTKKGRENGNK